MNLSDTGKMAHRFWSEIPNHFPFVQLGEFVVMPNHVHGIIIIDKPINLGNNDFVEMGVSTVPFTTDHKTDDASAKWKPGILGSIVNQYKRICTINVRKINPGFSWQSRFHDHIIRNYESFVRISNYIFNNPENWQNDKFC